MCCSELRTFRTARTLVVSTPSSGHQLRRLMNVTPLHDRLIVHRIDEGEQIVGGIIVPDSAKQKPQRGTVLAVGLGKIDV